MSAGSRVPDAATARPWGRYLVFALFAGAVVAFFVLGGPSRLSLDAVKEHRDTLLALTERHFVLAIAVAFAVYVAAVAFSLPVATLLSLLIGFLFGRWLGTAMVVAAATAGAALAFLAARYLFATAAQQRMGELGAKINAGFTANAFNYLLFLRLVPIFPFFLVNIAPALTGITLRTFVLATLVGIVPGAFVYVNLGQALGRIDSTRELVSPEILGALSLLGAIALIPVLWKRFRRDPDRVT